MSELCDCNTVVLCCYEKRTTGNKPQVERQFFKAGFVEGKNCMHITEFRSELCNVHTIFI